MNRVTKFAEKKIQELSANQDGISPFQNESYQGTKNFVNNNDFNMYYPTLLAQIETYRATTSSLEDRAIEILSRFGKEQKEKMSQEEIATISHNVLKMLKIDSHLIKAKTNDNKNEEFIICRPEDQTSVLFDPTKETIVNNNGKETTEPYKVSLNHETIQQMKEGEAVTIGTTNKENIYQESMKLGEKSKTLIKTDTNKNNA